MTTGEPVLPEPLEQFSGDGPFSAELRRQIATLEAMFGDAGLASLRSREPDHPAVRKFDDLQRLLVEDKPLHSPGELVLVRAVAEMLIDRSAWAVRPGTSDSYWDFIADAAARKHVESTIRVASQFEDTIAELFFWGWLKQEGFAAELIGDEGKPDILIGQGSSDEVWAEVKRVNEGSVDRAVERQLSKANKQIKGVDATGSGIVFLRIARPVERAAFDDRVPSDVRPYLGKVQTALSGSRFRSVGRAVLSWDDVMILGEPPARTLYVVRRRSVVVEHTGPRGQVPIEPDRLQVGRTVTTWATWTPSDTVPAAPTGQRAVRAGDVDISGLFNQESAGIVRPSHAVEALLDHDRLSVFDFGGSEFSLATRRVELGHEPYTLLVVATKQPGDERIQLSLAFRVFDSDEGMPLTDPEACLDVLLRRHGIGVAVGDQVGLLVQRARVELGPSGPSGLVKLANSEVQRGLVSALVRIDARGWADLAWVFAINRDSYERDVRAHQR